MVKISIFSVDPPGRMFLRVPWIVSYFLDIFLRAIYDLNLTSPWLELAPKIMKPPPLI